MHSECSFLLTSFTRSAFVARFSTCIVFFLFNMSKAKFKYLVHPLLGKPENCLPREIYSAFLAAQVEIDHVCKCLDNIKLTMDDLKKACDESSKETKPEYVYGTFIRRLLYANTVSDTVIEKKIGATLLQKLREQGLAQGGEALNERKNRLHQLNPFVQRVVTEHILPYVVQFWIARVKIGQVPKPRRDRFLYVSFGEKLIKGYFDEELEKNEEITKILNTKTNTFVKLAASTQALNKSLSPQLIKVLKDASVRGYLCNVVDKSVQVSKQKPYVPKKTEDVSRQSASATFSPWLSKQEFQRQLDERRALLSQGDDCVAQHIRNKLLEIDLRRRLHSTG